MKATSADRRPLAAWLALLGVEVVAVVVLAVAPTGLGPDARASLRSLAAPRTLTDLALWSEAGYCRHPSQADRFAPWSTHPAALEHFPAGTFAAPAARRSP